MHTTRELAAIELRICEAFKKVAVGDIRDIERLIAGPQFLRSISVAELRARHFQADKNDGATACLKGNCGCKLANCHLIQVASLSYIADDGHLVEFNFPNDPDSPGGILANTAGIRKFSTFRGFCAAHDAALFRGIDTLDPNDEPSAAQIFAWHARSVAATYVRNRRNLAKQMNFASIALGHTNDVALRRATISTAWRTLRGDTAIRQELGVAMAGDHSGYQLRSAMTAERLPFAGAGFCTLDVDVGGKAIPAADRTHPPAITLAIIPGRAATRVFFVCRNQDWTYLEPDWSAVESQLSEGRFDRLLSYAVRSALRVGISPKWWSSQTPDVRDALAADIDDVVARTMRSMQAT